jgi:hypothetical protein
MLDETIQQANQVFSFPLMPSNTPVIVQQTKKQMIIMPEMANTVICPDTGKSLKHSDLITLLCYKIRWMRSTKNESGPLAQGLKRGIKGTNTLIFIRRYDVPEGRKTTYDSFVVDIKTHMEETESMRLTVGGDQIEYPGDTSTRTAGLTRAKMLFNSTISTPGTKFLAIDINNFYLNTPPPRTLHIYVHHDGIPHTIGDRQILFRRPST